MAAYSIVDELNVSDPETIKDYIKKAGVTIRANGGELLASGIPEALEGEWLPKRCVLVKFETMERLISWWNSDEYQALIPIRTSVSENNIIITDGL